MFKDINKLQLSSVAISIAVLLGCGSSSDSAPGEILLTCNTPMVPDAAGAMCIAPVAIQCPLPTVPDENNEICVIGLDPNAAIPTIFPSENQAVLFYNRPDDKDNTTSNVNYDNYRLHTWNDDTCNAYGAEYSESDWNDGHKFTGIDPVYGAYWQIDLLEDHNGCGNFIIHDGDDKELGGGNKTMPLNQDDPDYIRMNFTISKNGDVFEYPIASLGEQPLLIEEIAAHWIDSNTLVWDIASLDATSVKLHYSRDASLEIDPDTKMLNGTVITLTSSELNDTQKAIAPLVNEWLAFEGEWSSEEAKTMLKSQIALAAYDADGQLIKATFIQAGKVLDALYTSGDNDADEAVLGVNYVDDKIEVAVWAPTAQTLKLNVYNSDKTLANSIDMVESSATGIWSYNGDVSSLDRQFYKFDMSVYHSQNTAIEQLEVTDPYSISLSTNGDYSQFVNLNDESLKPDGWDDHVVPTITDPEDAIIYEGHIRDFSVSDSSTSEANRGKYLAFTEDSTPVKHLNTLVENGLTHFQSLPSNDIASINEGSYKKVNITDTVGDLCQLKPDAKVCVSEDESTIITDVFASYSPYTNDARDLVEVMREFDDFNWGYDPKHFNAPEGSYSSNPDGVARIVEMRAMNMALHDVGLRVVMDVVYNHTNAAGLWDNSVLDKVVPGYYHNRDITTGEVIQSTCCNDTALEHQMMDKLMVDSLLNWTTNYAVDGFRFDLMGHGTKNQMIAARESVQAVDPDNYFYGEAWDPLYQGGDRGLVHAHQMNLAGSEIGTFNDRLRDRVRNGALFITDGDLNDQDIIRLGMAGTLANYTLKSSSGTAKEGRSFSPSAYAQDPADIINYIDKHDNETLWDKLQLSLPYEMTLSDRVRAQNVAQSIVLMSQGIPFMQMGSDLLRSKSLDNNTYDAGDWFNRVDFEMSSNNWNVGLPLNKGNLSDDELVAFSSNPQTSVSQDNILFASNIFNEFLKIRSQNKLLRLTTKEDIISRVGFHNIGKSQTQGLIVMSIDDGLASIEGGVDLIDIDENVDAIVVIVNASSQEQSHNIDIAVGFELIANQTNSADSEVQAASFTDGTFKVPALTTAVFVKPQGEVQGIGLSAFATAGAPDVVPFGDTEVFIRGGMNGWSTDDQLVYQGEGIYEVEITLTATNYEFKIASEGWDIVNIGGDYTLVENEAVTITSGDGNMKFTPSKDGTYIFTIDANDTAAPIITISNEDVYADTSIYVRGDINGWGETDPMMHIGASIYSATVSISQGGDKSFKVASADWSTVNLGAIDTNVVENQWSELLSGSNDNFNFNFDVADYTFLVDAADFDNQLVSIFKSKLFGETTIYIRGTMNDWSTDNALVYQGNGTYSTTLNLNAGDYMFKFADSDWSTFNFGGNDAVTLGRNYTQIESGGGDIPLTIIEEGSYTFTITGPELNSPTLKVSQN